MIKTSVAADVLRCAQSTGADFAEIFLENTIHYGVSVLDGGVYNAADSCLHGAGVRVIRGVRSAYAYTNDTTPSGLMRAADQAAAALGTGTPNSPQAIGQPTAAPCAHPVQVWPNALPPQVRIDALMQAYHAARCPEIVQATSSWVEDDQTVQIINSSGLNITDRRCRVRLRVTAVASDGSQNQTGSESPGAHCGLEFLQALDPAALGRSAADTAVTMLHADECPAAFLPVVMEGGFGGVIIHEACVHSLEATSVAKNASEFCGRLGQKIAAPCVTVVDDGTITNAWGSNNIDDEGRPTQRNVLIQNGVLQTYLVDYLGGLRMGAQPNGCGRRQGYMYAPTSRMSNTFIAPGQDDENQMISTLAEGLYAKRMGGGSVNPATGEFNFAVLEGYWIKNGKLDRPVRGATLVGRGSEVLLNIDRVGSNLAFGQGMCGSLSGSVPTDVGQPRIRISQLTIGGRQ